MNLKKEEEITKILFDKWLIPGAVISEFIAPKHIPNSKYNPNITYHPLIPSQAS